MARARFLVLMTLAGCGTAGSGSPAAVDKDFGSYVAPDTLKNVTEAWAYNGAAVSVWPELLNELPKGDDHSELMSVYHFDLEGDDPEHKRRVEVYWTSGDCGSTTYYVTDVEQAVKPREGQPTHAALSVYYNPRVYYVEKYSAWQEGCERGYDSTWVTEGQFLEEEPSGEAQMEFIRSTFIKNGRVNDAFIPTCIGMASYQVTRNECITKESLGDLGA